MELSRHHHHHHHHHDLCGWSGVCITCQVSHSTDWVFRHDMGFGPAGVPGLAAALSSIEMSQKTCRQEDAVELGDFLHEASWQSKSAWVNCSCARCSIGSIRGARNMIPATGWHARTTISGSQASLKLLNGPHGQLHANPFRRPWRSFAQCIGVWPRRPLPQRNGLRTVWD